MNDDQPDESPVEGPEETGVDQSPPSLAHAVQLMLNALQLGPEHSALVHLATEYALQIDLGDADELAKLGPKLESVCVRLGVRPAAGGEADDGSLDELADFRARRSS